MNERDEVSLINILITRLETYIVGGRSRLNTDGEAVIMLAFQASGTGSTPVRCTTADVGLIFSLSFCFLASLGQFLRYRMNTCGSVTVS